MCFDVVTHPVQPVARQPVRRCKRDRRRVNEASRDLHREGRVQRIGENMVEKTMIDLIGDRRCYLRNQGIVKGGPWLEMGGAAAYHVRDDTIVGSGALQDLNKPNWRGSI